MIIFVLVFFTLFNPFPVLAVSNITSVSATVGTPEDESTPVLYSSGRNVIFIPESSLIKEVSGIYPSDVIKPFVPSFDSIISGRPLVTGQNQVIRIIPLSESSFVIPVGQPAVFSTIESSSSYKVPTIILVSLLIFVTIKLFLFKVWLALAKFFSHLL